jgi:hypothetical protein
MKRTVIIFLSLITGFTFPVQADNFDRVSAGAKVGYTNYKKCDVEVFLLANSRFGNIPLEPLFGVTYRSFTTDFKGVDELVANSAGFFLGVNAYPFGKIFYAGARFDVDMNWLNDHAMSRLNQENIPVIRTFPGVRLYTMVGVDIPIDQRLSLRFSGMPGWQNYIISDNWKVTASGPGFVMETRNGVPYNRFVWQINAGFAVKIWNK